ncbi:MAG: hypothetical protein JNL40_05295 [Cyclobacteriaceae bacterium]|nr:hypothetical protein [Cyclobacteriaceae bacterium]
MDSSQPIDFHTSPYFPGSLRALGVITLFLLVVPGIHWMAKVIILLIGLVLVTSHNRLRFDMAKKEYFDYVWMLGFRWGEGDHFDRIEYLFLKRNRMRQNMNSMMSSSTIHMNVYDGYLRISEKNKIHLLTSRNKETVMKKLKALASILNVDILDYTDREA